MVGTGAAAVPTLEWAAGCAAWYVGHALAALPAPFEATRPQGGEGGHGMDDAADGGATARRGEGAAGAGVDTATTGVHTVPTAGSSAGATATRRRKKQNRVGKKKGGRLGTQRASGGRQRDRDGGDSGGSGGQAAPAT